MEGCHTFERDVEVGTVEAEIGTFVYIWSGDEWTAFLPGAGEIFVYHGRVESSGGGVETFSAVETDGCYFGCSNLKFRLRLT